MDPSNPITIGLAGFLVTIAGGGIGVFVWFRRQLDEMRDSVLKAIHESRSEGDKRIADVAARVDALTEQIHEHELHVERKFLSKETANLVFERLEGAIAGLRTSIEARLTQLSESMERLWGKGRS